VRVAKFLSAAIEHPAVVPFFYLLPKVHKLPAISREHLHLLKGRAQSCLPQPWVTNAMTVWLADNVLNTTCFEQCLDVLPDSKTLTVQLLVTSAASMYQDLMHGMSRELGIVLFCL
jgi:hypothetical protein